MVFTTQKIAILSIIFLRSVTDFSALKRVFERMAHMDNRLNRFSSNWPIYFIACNLFLITLKQSL